MTEVATKERKGLKEISESQALCVLCALS